MYELAKIHYKMGEKLINDLDYQRLQANDC